MTKRVESVEDLEGSDALTIPDSIRNFQPADAIAWLQKNYGKQYDFADPARLVADLTNDYKRLCREEWEKGY